MTNRCQQVPEPDQQKKESNEPPPPVDPPVWSSDDDDSGDDDVEPNENGYQPLTLAENGAYEVLREPLNWPDSDEQIEDTVAPPEPREITINPDLVLSTMKDIPIPGSSIPPWAKEMSDQEWMDVVKRTIQGDNNDTSTCDTTRKADSQ